MAIEKLSDYFSASKGPLQRIYIAYQLQELIKKEWNEAVVVAVGDKGITISCRSAGQASMLTMRKQKLYALVSRVISNQRLPIRIVNKGR